MLHDSSCKEAVAVHNDYSESKTELFINNLQKLFEENQLGYDFDDFLNIYNAKIDNFFKLDQPKISKRNWQVNPWITDGLITSIRKETFKILGKAQLPNKIRMVTHNSHAYQMYAAATS